MSLSQKNRILTEEHKMKIGLAHKGKSMSKESVEKSIQTKRDRGIMVGANNVKAKLSQEYVDMIRVKLITLGISEIAKEYNVSYQTVHSIKNNKTWIN